MHRPRRGPFAIALVLAAVALPEGGPASAAGPVTLRPVADTFVDESRPFQDAGADPTLLVDGRPRRRAYLRFDVPASSTAIESVHLRVYARTKIGFDVHQVASVTWSETATDWSTAPALGAAIGSSGTVTANSWVTVDVTAAVSRPGPVSLALATGENPSQQIDSREGRSPPELVVHYEDPPTTTTTSTTTTSTSTTSTSTTSTSTTTTTTTTIPSGSSTQYYLDSVRGSDGNAGTTPAAPWRTLAPLDSVALKPGDRVFFARGSTWTGPLRVGASGTAAQPITVAPYGTGARPLLTNAANCVEVTGSFVVITGLEARSCSWAGIRVTGQSNRIDGNLVTGNAAGIQLAAGSADNVVTDNDVVDNDRMSVLTASPTDDDSGAFGILVNGDRTEIAGNRISGSDAFSYDYGRDGAAIEVYNAQGTTIHHNVGSDNDAFAELGGPRTNSTTLAFNVVRSSLDTSVFLVTRGAESSRGPVLGTLASRNTVALTGARSQGVVCYDGCAPEILKMRGNILVAQWKALYADSPADEDYDMFGGSGSVPSVIGPHSWRVDPQFVDLAGGDLHLRASSPAVDRGVAGKYQVDIDGDPAALDGNGDGSAVPDIGADELRLASPPPTTTTTTTTTSTTSTTTTTTPPTTSSTTTTTVPPPAGGPVTAIAETDPVGHSGDAADDPAIWLHPTDRALSTVIGTDKLGALEVYDLSGRRLHRYAVGDVNNVDLRYGFTLGGRAVDLVVASDQTADTLRIFRVDPVTRGLVEISANGGLKVGLGIAGLCMYRSPTDGSTYVFDADSSGSVQQWRLNGTSDGTVTGTLVRSFTLSSVTEGCVADDDHGTLYISQEDVAIWRYGAEPNAGTTRTQVDSVSGGRLVADIEGLAIYYRGDGSGYLIASSQGDDSYAVYERAAPHRFVGRFQVVAGVVDGVSHTDGLDVVSVDVGPTLAGGLLVVQDDNNTGSNQNFKLVPWASVAANVGALTTGLGWDPRAS